MLRAPFRGRRLQKRTKAQWDMRPWLRADGGANESMSLQLRIKRLGIAELGERRLLRFEPETAATLPRRADPDVANRGLHSLSLADLVDQ